MNDKQENQHFGEEGSAEPITKKVAKFSALIYLGLAITVVIVATVGIFNMSYDYDVSLDPISIPEISFGGEFSVPDVSLPQTVPPSDTPVGNEESGVTDDIESSQPPQEKPSEQPTVKYYFPVNGKIIKGYSMDKLVFSETMNDYRVHSGIDIAAEEGTPVICFSDGIVETITEDYFYGTTVSVSHADGSTSYYMNLDTKLAANILVGNKVLAGQQIGSVGNTAKCENADPSHLHFEIRVDDVLVDPHDELPI